MATQKNDEVGLAMAPDDARVVAALVANHRRFLAFVTRRVGNPEVAEEILQNAFVKTLEHDTGFDREEGVVQWVYRLLRNAIIDHARSQDVRRRGLEKQQVEATMEQEGPAQDSTVKNEICGCMAELLPGLRPEYATMVQKVDLEERSVQDVAQELGISPNNATVRLHRARQALKKQLERSCGTCATHGCLDCSCGS